jgi:predicted O-linked N-acetylglucosamine transferase (SPINDLY family)
MYSEDASPLEQLADAQSFGRYFADPLLRRRPFPNVLDVARKLRIGFVSGDFFEHAVNHFFEPVIKNFDAERFETFAYSNTIKEDAVTERLKPLFTHWRSILGISDDAAADLIEADQIDILVDLSGHTAGNRLLVFARKPAPIQVSWIGYPGTTGMAAIDYRLTDHVTEPEGLTEHLNTEILWRLPRMAACYQPSALTIPVMNHPPSDDNGYVTFGCINRFAKVTDSVLAVWAQILARVPTARLLLEVGDIENPEFRAETEARFERLGLPLDRVILEPRRAAYMLFHRMDVALDPFPFNGVTTSMDTLWMGVPFVALAGTHLISRLGSAILTTAGLPELVAQTPDEYVEVAARLARDADWLRTVRHDLRDRLTRSPLMDHKGLADEVGVAFRGMWTGWVTRASLECAS